MAVRDKVDRFLGLVIYILLFSVACGIITLLHTHLGLT